MNRAANSFKLAFLCLAVLSLSSCAGGRTVGEHIADMPPWMGGLPADAPPRRGTYLFRFRRAGSMEPGRDDEARMIHRLFVKQRIGDDDGLQLTPPCHSRRSACGAAAITIIVRDGLGTIITGKTTTGTVAARWSIAGSWRHSDVPSAIAALQRSAASLQATLTPHDIAIYANPLASFVPVKQWSRCGS